MATEYQLSFRRQRVDDPAASNELTRSRIAAGLAFFSAMAGRSEGVRGPTRHGGQARSRVFAPALVRANAGCHFYFLAEVVSDLEGELAGGPVLNLYCGLLCRF